MSEQDADQSNSFNNQWKKRFQELGQGAFEFEEMLRLGFIDLDTIKRFDKEINSINRIEELLAEIRSRRIKRVKEAAKEKKIKKQEEKIKRSKEICK